MIIVLKKGVQEAELDSFLEGVKKRGFGVHISKGVDKTIVGLLGDTSKIDPEDLLASDVVESAERVSAPYKMASRIHLAFEELVQQVLIPVLKQPSVQAVIEYSEAEESAVLTVRYNGPAYDVTKQGDELSLKVLQSAVSDMAYTWDENAERHNQAVLRIRQA